ncbi:hypothetical protein I6I72_05940 [Corynebacterium striatum]|uniref:Uncharacterized protein n=1 Tax=Corynebacterium striatum TaxID=43770 RepID=A0ABX7DKM5_CORST|nr:hypothetical protein [Corynebacterium striatum]QQU78425.1 hypothetical protein I6I72_05940 [Corynebacterium striatum]
MAANFFLHPDSFANPWAIPAAALNLVSLMAAPRFPLPTWAGYLVLFLLLSMQPGIRVIAFTFFTPVTTAIVAYRGHTTAATIGIILLW